MLVPIDSKSTQESLLGSRSISPPTPAMLANKERRMKVKALVDPLCASFTSKHTRIAYRFHMEKFLKTHLPFTRTGLQLYIGKMRARKISTSTFRSVVCVLRRFVQEAQLADIISGREAHKMYHSLPKTKVQVVRFGTWLTAEGARRFYDAPDRTTFKGKRDACALALMLGCGLRREEAANFLWSYYREIDGRMCIVDLPGKGGKLRTIPVPAWARPDLDAWKQELEGYTGRIAPGTDFKVPFLATQGALCAIFMGKGYPGPSLGGKLSPWSVWGIVGKYAKQLGVAIKPHDLRRSLAQLMRKNGATLEQIQLVLGHSDVAVTQRYLGGAIELAEGKAATDLVKI